MQTFALYHAVAIDDVMRLIRLTRMAFNRYAGTRTYKLQATDDTHF